jgi:hypothetical protein
MYTVTRWAACKRGGDGVIGEQLLDSCRCIHRRCCKYMQLLNYLPTLQTSERNIHLRKSNILSLRMTPQKIGSEESSTNGQRDRGDLRRNLKFFFYSFSHFD